jgi:DnaJ homolog subfamily C member 7
MADYQRAISLRTFKPSAKIFIRLAQCQLAVGCITPSLIALREALLLEPTNNTTKELKAKVITLNSHVGDFVGARSRNHWRMAQVSYEKGRQIIADQGGDIPTEWLCWGIEIEIARGNWEVALRGAK